MSNEQQCAPDSSRVSDRIRCECSWLWFSGLFAGPAFVNLVRALGAWRVEIGAWNMPLWMSWAGACLFGALAIACALASCRKERQVKLEGKPLTT